MVIQLKPFGNSDLLVLNPFVDEQQKLTFHSPKLYSLEYPPNWRGAGPIIYDPSLQRAAIAGINDVYFLADVENGRILASIQSISFLQFSTRSPQWSPDGTQVIIAASNAPLMDFKNDELFSVNRDGIVTKLTEFNNLSITLGITRYGWSPDGRYIAFLFVLSPSQHAGEQLALLNTNTAQLYTYCIQADTTGNYRKNLNGFYDDQIYSGVIWSPNSKQMIVENRIETNQSKIILVDLEQNTAFDIIDKENLQPIGWMVNP